MNTPPPLRAGLGRASVTAFDPAHCLFGWGYRENRGLRVEKPLYARALVVEDPTTSRRVAYVCCDLGMISESVRAHVLPRVAALRLSEHDVMLTATHTHSGPSGFSSYLFYAIAGPGFSQTIHDAIVDGIVAAITAATAALQPARLYVSLGAVPLTEPVAFNRAVRSYNRNPDVTPVDRRDRDQAVDRTMTVLTVDALDGRPLGLVSWFGVHCTTVHRDHQVIHPDHKGEASLQLESAARAAGHPDFVALFAQTAAGDVSPNQRWDAARRMTVGPLDDDLHSAALLGAIQARCAQALANKARQAGPILSPADPRAPSPIDGALRYVDFFSAPVDPRFVAGRTGLRSAPPVLGWAYTAGTREGPGPFQPVHTLTSTLAQALRPLSWLGLPADEARMHGPKFPFVQLAHGRRNRICGFLSPGGRLAARIPDPFVDYLHRAVLDSDAAEQPWVPRYLPVQILRLGPLCIVALPTEPTVQSGRRLARSVADVLAPSDAQAGREPSHVVVNGYANAYAGYVTTPEEYSAQRYEGAASLFGMWALPAFCTALSDLARDLTRPAPPPAWVSAEGRVSLGRRPSPPSLPSAVPHT